MSAQSERKTRLTEAFVGKTIESIDADCINVLHFRFTDGSCASLDTDEVWVGIPVIQLTPYPN